MGVMEDAKEALVVRPRELAKLDLLAFEGVAAVFLGWVPLLSELCWLFKI